ncbi:hypothetical protein F4779DRAFT_613150 [Xylariaceae sp. FL0662B]|nr:hypothetical protein F4779DRAFT_613150 [Xylariaceae sp. FL0662B]
MVIQHDESRTTSMNSALKMDGPLTRELSLYMGISNRSRGWKTRKSDKATEINPSCNPAVLRWDGASRSYAPWDNLRRDPELWYRNGNCYIHLHEKGQSRRGPAFKVPFSALLETSCYPLIDRFMILDIPRPSEHAGSAASHFGHMYGQSRIELFIPAPPKSNKQQAYHYHLATRNFFAFVLRRSVVGENLGTALITLLHSMHEFRNAGVDNVQDLMSYMDEEGYLNLNNQPSHAVAMLHLAEAFQLRDLYINALAHCCGMSDQLFLGPEYWLLSPVTTRLIHYVRVEMDLRLGKSANMLRTFLQDELSGACLGLYPGARAHLERFRTLLHGFYAARFGYYPPPSIEGQTAKFEAGIFRTMRADFEALYRYLVDEGFDISQDSPFLAEGGICTLQSVQSFDRRQTFRTLFHPLPLLPEVSQENTSPKLAWLTRSMRSTQKQRESTHAALLKSTNQRPELLKNRLVRAYRQFEEDSVYLPTKADKIENLGPKDARKVRWILIYSVYQTLRHATECPTEVQEATDTPYSVCISATNLPPWKQGQPVRALVRRQSEHIIINSASSTPEWCATRTSSPSPPLPSSEIKPDIDYLAFSQQGDATIVPKERRARLQKTPSPRGSLTRSRSFRRSLSIFNGRRSEEITEESDDERGQGTVVNGYGIRTKDGGITAAKLLPPKASMSTLKEESTSVSSFYRDSSDSSSSGAGSTETADTSIHESPMETAASTQYSRQSSMCVRCVDVDEDVNLPPRRIKSTESGRAAGTRGPVKSFLRRPKSVDGGFRHTMEPAPLAIRKADMCPIEMPAPMSPTAWDYIKAVMEVKASDWMEDDVQPEWEKYTDLGGHAVLRSDTSVAAPRFRPASAAY